jgi:tRNA (adenine22-N1)-methyltransferase
LNKRIKIISSYINEDDKVADIGCDQALLSELLAKRKMYSVASDIKENIVLNAKKRLENLNLDNYVNFIISDGLDNIPNDIDALVLSGMGTYTILKIISKSKKQYKKVITISNNNNDILRAKMLDFGYKILLEEIIYDKNKYYNLIVFIPGEYKYTKEELLFGVNHKNEELFIKKLKFDLNKYKEIYDKSKEKNILDIIKTIEKKLKNY